MPCMYLRGPVPLGPNMGSYYCENENRFIVGQMPPNTKPGLAPADAAKCLEGDWPCHRVKCVPIFVPPNKRGTK